MLKKVTFTLFTLGRSPSSEKKKSYESFSVDFINDILYNSNVINIVYNVLSL